MSNHEYAKGGVIIEWTPTNNEVEEYHVYRSTEYFDSIDNMEPIFITDNQTFKFIDYDIFDGTTYYYSVGSVYKGLVVLSPTREAFIGEKLEPIMFIIGGEGGTSAVSGVFNDLQFIPTDILTNENPIKQVLGSDHHDHVYLFYKEGHVDVYDYNTGNAVKTIIPSIDYIPSMSFDDQDGNFYSVISNVITKYTSDLSSIKWTINVDKPINNYMRLPNGDIVAYNSSIIPRTCYHFDGNTGEKITEFSIGSEILFDWRDNGDALSYDSSSTYSHSIKVRSLTGEELRVSNGNGNGAYYTYDRVHDTILFRYRSSSSATLSVCRIRNAATLSLVEDRVISNSASPVGIMGIVSDNHGSVYIRHRNSSTNPSSYVIYSLNYSGGYYWTRANGNGVTYSIYGRGGVGLLETNRAFGQIRVYAGDSTSAAILNVHNVHVNGERLFSSSRSRRTMSVLHDDGSVFVWRGRMGGIIQIVGSMPYVQGAITEVDIASDGGVYIQRNVSNLLEKVGKSGEVEWRFIADNLYKPIFDVDTNSNVYYTSNYMSTVNSFSNKLYKLDDKRRVIWISTSSIIPSYAWNGVLSTPDGKLFLHRNGSITKVNPANGEVVNSIDLPSGFTNMYTFWYKDDHIFLVNAENPRKVCKINVGTTPTNAMVVTPVWIIQLPVGSNINTPSLVTDSIGNIFVITAENYIHKLNSSGITQWSNGNLGKMLYNLTIDDNDNLYALGSDQTLNKLNTDGEIVDSTPLVTNNAGFARFSYAMMPLPGHKYL